MFQNHLCPECIPDRQTDNFHRSKVQIFNVVLKMTSLVVPEHQALARVKNAVQFLFNFGKI